MLFFSQEQHVVLLSVHDHRWTINRLQAIAASYKEASLLDLVKHKKNVLPLFLSIILTRNIQS